MRAVGRAGRQNRVDAMLAEASCPAHDRGRNPPDLIIRHEHRPVDPDGEGLQVEQAQPGVQPVRLEGGRPVDQHLIREFVEQRRVGGPMVRGVCDCEDDGLPAESAQVFRKLQGPINTSPG